MSMTVNCPSCQKKLRVSEEFLGKKMRCAACQQIFELPATPPSSDPPPQDSPFGGIGEEPAPPPRTRSRSDEEDYDRPRSRPARDDYEDREREPARGRGRYDDDDDRPRRRLRDEDDYDDRSIRRRSYGAPTACADANTALWMGIVGLLCCAFLSPIALIYGIKALNQINSSNGALTGQGQAIAGIILGALGVLALLFNIIVLLAGQGGM